MYAPETNINSNFDKTNKELNKTEGLLLNNTLFEDKINYS